MAIKQNNDGNKTSTCLMYTFVSVAGFYPQYTHDIFIFISPFVSFMKFM